MSEPPDGRRSRGWSGEDDYTNPPGFQEPGAHYDDPDFFRAVREGAFDSASPTVDTTEPPARAMTKRGRQRWGRRGAFAALTGVGVAGGVGLTSWLKSPEESTNVLGARGGAATEQPEAARPAASEPASSPSGASASAGSAESAGSAKGTPNQRSSGAPSETKPRRLKPRAAGKQPSKARTYGQRDESYMASQAGEELRTASASTKTTSSTDSTGNTRRSNDALPSKVHDSPQAAAEATEAGGSALSKDPALHLARRFTMGITPELLEEIRTKGIDGWLDAQFAYESLPQAPGEAMAERMPTRGKSIEELYASRESRQEYDTKADFETILATLAKQLWSERQLFEVMVDFWNDLLHVACPSDGNENVRGSFDTDVIRKFALDNYPDMFVAANRHPALLRYLNQNESRKDSVNENLARENMELYTVGVDGGYTEKDVRQAALLQSGRTIDEEEQFHYDPDAHYVGAVKIMDFEHANKTAEGGLEAGDAYMRYLALHPSTAKRIATQLCQQFVSDVPQPNLIERLASVYLKHKGSIVPVLRTLLSSAEFWASAGLKVHRPMDQLLATYRTLGVQPGSEGELKAGLEGLYNTMREMGHWPMGQTTPNGYPRVFVAWSSPGTFLSQWNEAQDAVNGSRKEFRYTEPEQLLGEQPPATAGAYVNALAKRLLGQRISQSDRAAVLKVADVSADESVDASFNGALPAVIRTLLASPQHFLK